MNQFSDDGQKLLDLLQDALRRIPKEEMRRILDMLLRSLEHIPDPTNPGSGPVHFQKGDLVRWTIKGQAYQGTVLRANPKTCGILEPNGNQWRIGRRLLQPVLVRASSHPKEFDKHLHAIGDLVVREAESVLEALGMKGVHFEYKPHVWSTHFSFRKKVIQFGEKALRHQMVMDRSDSLASNVRKLGISWSAPEQFLAGLILHEISHFIVEQRFGRRAAAHGREFYETLAPLLTGPIHAELSQRLKRGLSDLMMS